MVAVWPVSRLEKRSTSASNRARISSGVDLSDIQNLKDTSFNTKTQRHQDTKGERWVDGGTKSVGQLFLPSAFCLLASVLRLSSLVFFHPAPHDPAYAGSAGRGPSAFILHPSHRRPCLPRHGALALHAAEGVYHLGVGGENDGQAIAGGVVEGAGQGDAAAEGEGHAGRVIGPGAGLHGAI